MKSMRLTSGKTLIIIAIFLGTALVAASWVMPSRNKTILVKGTSPGFAVVELFTSQGCSSCPAADDVVMQLIQERKGEEVYALCYHVDYWDHIGWKDTYSNHAFTEKQEKYVKDLGLDGAYTPQMVVNGKVGFIGSDKGLASTAINNGLKMVTAAHIALSDVVSKNGKVEGQLATTGTNDKTHIVIALIEKSSTVAIKRGENKGRNIKYANTVRAYSTLKADAGKFSIDLAPGLAPANCELVAYLQDTENSAILQACKSTIQ